LVSYNKINIEKLNFLVCVHREYLIYLAVRSVHLHGKATPENDEVTMTKSPNNEVTGNRFCQFDSYNLKLLTGLTLLIFTRAQHTPA